MDSPRIIPCTHCGSEGRIIRQCIGYEPGCAHPHMHGERDDGECPVCEGTGGEIIETYAIEMEDLQ